MMLSEDVGDIRDLVKYRFESANNDIRSAKALSDIDDYNDFYIASKEEVNETIDTAMKFVSMVYCNKEMEKWEQNEV